MTVASSATVIAVPLLAAIRSAPVIVAVPDTVVLISVTKEARATIGNVLSFS